MCSRLFTSLHGTDGVALHDSSIIASINERDLIAIVHFLYIHTFILALTSAHIT